MKSIISSLFRRSICFVIGHRWSVANEYHSPIFHKVCRDCNKQNYFTK